MHKVIHIYLLLFVPSTFWAHSLLLNVFDNEDNTISVEGIFSTGEPAVEAQVLLKALKNGKILYKKRLCFIACYL